MSSTRSVRKCGGLNKAKTPLPPFYTIVLTHTYIHTYMYIQTYIPVLWELLFLADVSWAGPLVFDRRENSHAVEHAGEGGVGKERKS